MRYFATAVLTLSIVLNASLGVTGPARTTSNATTLGVPSYPGWTVHRLDDKADKSGKTHLYQYQYYSDDPADRIVKFYEERLQATAAFMGATYTYTLTASDGALVQITAPEDGVPQMDEAGEPTGKTWAALITIIRFQDQ